MRKIQFTTMVIGLTILSFSCSKDKQVSLFNGEDLKDWVIVVPEDVQPDSVFWVEDGFLTTSGIPNAYIRTKKEYDNYTLHVEWRWLEEPKNSGVLLHVSGEDFVWPNCIEAQLMAGNAGDFVLIGKGVGITVQDSSYAITSEENRFGVAKKFQESSEFEPGEWNSYDILVNGDMITLTVNGVLQNKATEATKTSGHIALQSEGGPMQFRNINLVPLE